MEKISNVISGVAAIGWDKGAPPLFFNREESRKRKIEFRLALLSDRQILAGVEFRIEHKNSRSILLRITCLQNRCVYTTSRISSIVFISLM